MAEFNDSYDPLLEIIEAITNVSFFESYNNIEENGELIHRGLPNSRTLSRNALFTHIAEKQRKDVISGKLNDLKNNLLNKNRKSCIQIMASLMGELMEPTEKTVFIDHFSASSSDDDFLSHSMPTSRIKENPEYIPIQSQNVKHAPQIHKLEGSKSPVNGENKIMQPIRGQYNSSDVYLIHCGIKHCRALLKSSIEKSSNTVIKELKSNNVLHVVMSEQIKTGQNYFTMLVNNYPHSMTDIKFLLKEDRDLILKSSIFVNMAERNIANLKDFLFQLTKIVDENTLSTSCQQSQSNGVSLMAILNQNHTPEIKIHADSIIRFMDRYRQGPSY